MTAARDRDLLAEYEYYGMARASIVGDVGSGLGDGARPIAPIPSGPMGAYGSPSDPLLAPDYSAPSAADAAYLRAVVAPIIDSARSFAHRARDRAMSDDTRMAYANGAADAALVVSVMATESIAEAMRRRA